jgi:hypothetical protein
MCLIKNPLEEYNEDLENSSLEPAAREHDRNEPTSPAAKKNMNPEK